MTSELSNKEKIGSKHNIMESVDYMLPTQASTDGTTTIANAAIQKRGSNHIGQHYAATSLRSPIEKPHKLLIDKDGD